MLNLLLSYNEIWPYQVDVAMRVFIANSATGGAILGFCKLRFVNGE